MSDPCPYCAGPAGGGPGDGGTCGGFACLRRQFQGGEAPWEGQPRRPFPWGTCADVRRIAVFRPGRIGDLILAVPALRALRKGFLSAEIDLLAQPWAANLAERLRYIDRVLPLSEPRPGWVAPEPGSPEDLFLREAAGHRYDLVLQLHADGPAAARFALALGARATAGFCGDEEVGQVFHLVLPMLEDEPEVLRGLRLAHAVGADPDGVHLEFPVLPRDGEEVEALLDRGLPEGRPLVAIHPSARAPARRWPLRRFAELVHRIHDRWGAAIVLVGDGEDASQAESVGEASGVGTVNLAGKLSLGGLAALLSRVDLFVGSDSGPAQLAAAVAPRSVRIFGPANRLRWAPLDRARHRVVHRSVECSPCGHWECPIDHRCLAWVGVEEVMGEVEDVMEVTPAPSLGKPR